MAKKTLADKSTEELKKNRTTLKTLLYFVLGVFVLIMSYTAYKVFTGTFEDGLSSLVVPGAALITGMLPSYVGIQNINKELAKREAEGKKKV